MSFPFEENTPTPPPPTHSPETDLSPAGPKCIDGGSVPECINAYMSELKAV